MAICRRCKLPLIQGFGWCPYCGLKVENNRDERLQIPCKKCGNIMRRRSDEQKIKCRRCNKEYIICRNCGDIIEVSVGQRRAQCRKCGILN